MGLLFVLGVCVQAMGGQALTLGTATGSNGDTVTVDLTLSSTDAVDVQGLQAMADWVGSALQGASLAPGAVLGQDPPPAGQEKYADVVVRRVEPSYFVLGVVMDNGPSELPLSTGEKISIPAGGSVVVGRLSVKILVAPPTAAPLEVPLVFRDGIYNTVATGPKLDNIIVVGGLSVGKAEGMALNDGKVIITQAPPKFTIVSKTVEDPKACPATTNVSVTMQSESPVQGYVTAITHTGSPTLKLAGITYGAAMTAPDFFQPEISLVGGAFGVVMDFIEPFGAPLPIAPGTTEIAIYQYCLTDAIACNAIGSPKTVFTYALKFADFVLGDPLKENVIVVGGQSVNPILTDGNGTAAGDATLTLQSKDCAPPSELQSGFAVGGCSLVDGAADPTDPNKFQQVPGQVNGFVGDEVLVGLWYKFPPDLVLDEGARPELIHQIQGLSMSLVYDSSIMTSTGEYLKDGTTITETETVGAEFVNVEAENNGRATIQCRPNVVGAYFANKPKHGELVVGILVDALPPFDGQYLPPTDDWLKLLCVKFTIVSLPRCDSAGVAAPIYFCDRMLGKGSVPTRNLISVANLSWQPDQFLDGELMGGTVIVKTQPVFIRGDCNFNFIDHDKTITAARLAAHATEFEYWKDAVDIADAAAVISFLFQTGDWKFDAPCQDACDANDDGRVDLADSVFILRYLFKVPNTPPPRPFQWGPETDDEQSEVVGGVTRPASKTPKDRLDCKGGAVCF